jgi:hypothetical protein
MWPIAIISVILGLAGLLYFGYRKVKSEAEVKQNKIDALEEAAREKREKEKAQDAKEAAEIVASRDADRALKFLRESLARN